MKSDQAEKAGLRLHDPLDFGDLWDSQITLARFRNAPFLRLDSPQHVSSVGRSA
jgi:hypothetical protein